jgi:enoyl-CoA hydratase
VISPSQFYFPQRCLIFSGTFIAIYLSKIIFLDIRGGILMNFQTVIYETSDGIATITINRPEARNALNDILRKELSEALNMAAEDEGVRGIILTGGEEIFAAGADIKAMADLSAAEMFYKNMSMTRKLVEQMEELPKPIIAAIGGYALGGGCELILGCDYRIASENASLGFPEIKLGIFPGGGGSQRLPHLTGLSRAKDLIFSGRIITAAEALAYSLIDEVTPVGELTAVARKKMLSYIKHSPISLAVSKLTINRGFKGDFHTGNNLESLSFALLFSTHDQKEGMHAFMEKRKPEFTGK